MALTHIVAVRNGLTNYVVDLLDVGAGANGDLVITNASGTELAVLGLSNPAFDASGSAGGNSDGVATAESITSDTSAVAGTAAIYIMRDCDDNEVWRGTVTATGGGGDLEMSSVSFGTGDTVSITSFTYESSD